MALQWPCTGFHLGDQVKEHGHGRRTPYSGMLVIPCLQLAVSCWCLCNRMKLGWYERHECLEHASNVRITFGLFDITQSMSSMRQLVDQWAWPHGLAMALYWLPFRWPSEGTWTWTKDSLQWNVSYSMSPAGSLMLMSVQPDEKLGWYERHECLEHASNVRITFGLFDITQSMSSMRQLVDQWAWPHGLAMALYWLPFRWPSEGTWTEDCNLTFSSWAWN